MFEEGKFRTVFFTQPRANTCAPIFKTISPIAIGIRHVSSLRSSFVRENFPSISEAFLPTFIEGLDRLLATMRAALCRRRLSDAAGRSGATDAIEAIPSASKSTLTRQVKVHGDSRAVMRF